MVPTDRPANEQQQDMSRLDNIKFTPNPMHIHRFTEFIWQKSGRARSLARDYNDDIKE